MSIGSVRHIGDIKSDKPISDDIPLQSGKLHISQSI